jgi:hypothetical protein
MQRIERLVWHYEAEARLAQRLARDAGSLARYPHAQARVLATAERVRGRAERLRRALEALERPVTEPAAPSGPPAGTAWESLRDRVSDLGDMSEAALMDAQAVEREHPGTARLLYGVHRETAEDQRDLIWTLARLAGTAVRTTALDKRPVAA